MLQIYLFGMLMESVKDSFLLALLSRRMLEVCCLLIRLLKLFWCLKGRFLFYFLNFIFLILKRFKSPKIGLFLGVDRIWVHSHLRRKGLATWILDAARRLLSPKDGDLLRRSRVAFGDPNELCVKLAINYVEENKGSFKKNFFILCSSKWVLVWVKLRVCHLLWFIVGNKVCGEGLDIQKFSVRISFLDRKIFQFRLCRVWKL